jgi:hypothetical protein
MFRTTEMEIEMGNEMKNEMRDESFRPAATAHAAHRFAGALLAALSLTAGCAAGDGATDEPATAQIVVPLIQQGTQGELYHLANATFDITGRDGFAITLDGSGFESSLSANIPPGLFSIQLRDGWVLERSFDGGDTFVPVSALLGTPNPNSARALANQPTLVSFDFLLRETTSNVQIRLGVVPAPRQLAGGIVIDTATDGLAAYARTSFDFSVYFQLASLQSVVLPDGGKQQIYDAGQLGVIGPFPQFASAVAVEFYHDPIGILSGSVTDDLAGAFLEYLVTARPDGTVDLQGQLIGIETRIDFGPDLIDSVAPPLDADGFPQDVFFYDSTLPFALTNSLGTMNGVLRMRHLVPAR